MPCAVPMRGKTDLKLPPRTGWQKDPCGLPIVTHIELTDVSAENMCVFHQGFKRGWASIPRWIVKEGEASGWGAAEVSGTLGYVDPIYNILNAAPLSGPNNGEIVVVRVGTVVIGRYRVASSTYPGEFQIVGSRAYFHKANLNGTDNSAALAALVTTATTLDWRVV